MYNNPYQNFEEIGLSLRKKEEKCEIRQQAKFIGLTLVILLVVSFTWSFVYIIAAVRLGVPYNVALEILEEPAVLHTVQIVLSCCIFILPFLIVIANSGKSSKEVLAFGKSEKGLFLPLVLMGIGFCAFANIVTGIIGNIFSSIGIEYSAPEMETPEGAFGFVLVVLSTAVVPALVEEFALRGAVLGSLRKYGDGFAIGVSAILFGLIHGNLVQIPFAFVVGLALGYAVVKTGTVWTGVVIHFINNFISILLDTALSHTESVYIENAVGTVYYMLCLLCFFIGLLLLKNKSGSVLRTEEPEMLLSNRQKLATFFSSPMIIIFMALVAIECVIYTAS